MGSANSSNASNNDQTTATAVICGVATCNAPAIRLGPGPAYQPLCRRHLLATCREAARAREGRTGDATVERGSPRSHWDQRPMPHAALLETSNTSVQISQHPSKTIQLGSNTLVQFIAVCMDTKGYVGNSFGCIVPAEFADQLNSRQVSRPALFVAAQSKFNPNRLQVLSPDGSQRLQCYCCRGVDLRSRLCGLYCHGQRLLVAQSQAVTVMDLSGRVLFVIPSGVLKGSIDGELPAELHAIGGTEQAFFIHGGDRVAVYSKTAGKWEALIDLDLFQQQPQSAGSDVSGAATDKDDLLVIDKNCKQIRRLCINSRRPVATYPAAEQAGTGLNNCAGRLASVATDSKGRIFASDCGSNSVYVISNDGRILQTLGGASDRQLLSSPRGLTIVPAAPWSGSREQLVVADCGHRRLLFFDL